MGRTCGVPDEIGLTAIGVELNGSRRVPSVMHAALAASSVSSRDGVTAPTAVWASRSNLALAHLRPLMRVFPGVCAAGQAARVCAMRRSARPARPAQPCDWLRQTIDRETNPNRPNRRNRPTQTLTGPECTAPHRTTPHRTAPQGGTCGPSGGLGTDRCGSIPGGDSALQRGAIERAVDGAPPVAAGPQVVVFVPGRRILASVGGDLVAERAAVGQVLIANKIGNIFRVGIFLDFVWLTTRTEGPHGAYVRRARAVLRRANCFASLCETPCTRYRCLRCPVDTTPVFPASRSLARLC